MKTLESALVIPTDSKIFSVKIIISMIVLNAGAKHSYVTIRYIEAKLSQLKATDRIVKIIKNSMYFAQDVVILGIQLFLKNVLISCKQTPHAIILSYVIILIHLKIM